MVGGISLIWAIPTNIKNTNRTLVDDKEGSIKEPKPGATGVLSLSFEEEGATIPDTTPNPMKVDVQEQAPTPTPPIPPLPRTLTSVPKRMPRRVLIACCPKHRRTLK